MSDMKQSLATGARPQLSQIPRAGLIYTSRALEYGSAKYARSNFYGPPPVGVDPAARLLGYIDAAMRHLTRVADSVNRAFGTGGDVARACAVVDADGGGKFPASDLPDLAHALASLVIAVECGVQDGLLPADPGQPWRALLVQGKATPELAQKDDPASERARIKALVDARVKAGAYDVLPPNGSGAV